jgi:Tfp pilus assembly protein PilN
MRALELDFLNPVRTRTRLGLLVLLAGLGAIAAVGFRAQTLDDQVQVLRQRVGDSRKLVRRDTPATNEPARDPKLVAQEVIRANAVLSNLAVPWDALFGELESAASGNVALLAIQPASGGRKVQLSGEARRFEDLLAYVARLEGTAGFGSVFLTEHELRASGGERVVTFTVTADWVGRE